MGEDNTGRARIEQHLRTYIENAKKSVSYHLRASEAYNAGIEQANKALEAIKEFFEGGK